MAPPAGAGVRKRPAGAAVAQAKTKREDEVRVVDKGVQPLLKKDALGEVISVEADEEEEGAPTARASLAEWEGKRWCEGLKVVAGADEAGRGPLAGPVVAAAFAILEHEDEEVVQLMEKVADSKQLSAQQRDELYKELTDSRFVGRTTWAIAEASVAEIDEQNILQASLSAMARAVRDLKVLPDCVLVDGCNRPADLLAAGEQWTRGSRSTAQEASQKKLSNWFTKASRSDAAGGGPGGGSSGGPPAWRPSRVEAVIGGDAKVLSISAASILAKVHRDRLMDSLHRSYPRYGFDTHKGYGTPDHLAALEKHGVCPEHRRSFAPIRKVLGLPEDPLPAGQQKLTASAFGSAAVSTPASKGKTKKAKHSTGIADVPTPAKKRMASAPPPGGKMKKAKHSAGIAEVPTPAKKQMASTPPPGGPAEATKKRMRCVGKRPLEGPVADAELVGKSKRR